MDDWQKIPHYFWYFTVLYLTNLSTLAKNPTIMQKQLFTLMAAILLSASFLTGCKEDPPPPAKTKSELITQGSWKFGSASASGVGDVSSSVNACLKDNILIFVSGGTLTVDEGAIVCSPSYAGSNTWVFANNETIVRLSAPLFPGGSNDFTLVSISETNLVLSQVMTVAPYPPTTIEVTFKH